MSVHRHCFWQWSWIVCGAKNKEHQYTHAPACLAHLNLNVFVCTLIIYKNELHYSTIAHSATRAALNKTQGMVKDDGNVENIDVSLWARFDGWTCTTLPSENDGISEMPSADCFCA